MNILLSSSPQKRNAIAFTMIHHAYIMLGYGGFQTEVNIDHPTFQSPIHYKTDTDGPLEE